MTARELVRAFLHASFPGFRTAGNAGLVGYLRIDETTGEATVMYCKRYDGRVLRSISYRRVGFVRSLFLWMAMPMRRIFRMGRFAIDAADIHALDALAYLHASGRIYLRIPSLGWFTGDEIIERKPRLWKPIHIDPDAPRRALRKRISPN
jgi:hypothetical protein